MIYDCDRCGEPLADHKKTNKPFEVGDEFICEGCYEEMIDASYNMMEDKAIRGKLNND